MYIFFISVRFIHSRQGYYSKKKHGFKQPHSPKLKYLPPTHSIIYIPTNLNNNGPITSTAVPILLGIRSKSIEIRLIFHVSRIPKLLSSPSPSTFLSTAIPRTSILYIWIWSLPIFLTPLSVAFSLLPRCTNTIGGAWVHLVLRHSSRTTLLYNGDRLGHWDGFGRGCGRGYSICGRGPVRPRYRDLTRKSSCCLTGCSLDPKLICQ